MKRREKIDFTLRTREYKRLHLILYFVSIVFIVFLYFLIIVIFSSYSQNTTLTAIISLFVGVYLVFNRDKLVTYISHYMYDRERKKIKKQNKAGLKRTIRRLAPKKRKIKLNIKDKTPLKDRLKNLKNRFKKKGKDKPDYIEIE